MRLYLGLDIMTALSNDIAQVEIHYLPHYDLIKLHGITRIFLWQRVPLHLAFYSSCMNAVSDVTGM